MIGVLIVTHGNFGKELLRSAELIMGEQENVRTLSLNHGDDVEELYSSVNEELELLDEGEGVLVLTDLFEGSPYTAVVNSIKKACFESLTGVNLPMLMEALDSRANSNIKDLACKAYKSGVKGIKDIRYELNIANGSI